MTEKHDNLAAALAAFQAHLPRVKATANGQVAGNRNYKYGDLADITHAVLPDLAKHGLAWLCMPTRTEDGAPVLRWKLAHESGQVETGDYELPTGVTPQQMGSAITYGRRYTLTSVTGVVADADDDGAAASDTRTQQRRQQPQPDRPRAVQPAPSPDDTPADKARADLRVLAKEKGVTLEVVANRYKAIHGTELKAEEDAGKIAEFAATLNAPAEAAS